MGIWSSITDFFADLWNQIKSLIDDILTFIAENWVIIAFVIILFAPFFSVLLAGLLPAWCAPILASFATWANALTLWEMAAWAFGTGLLLFPSETIEFVTEIAETVAELAAVVGEAVGDIASSFLGGLLNSPMGWGLLAIGTILLISSTSSNDSPQPVVIKET